MKNNFSKTFNYFKTLGARVGSHVSPILCQLEKLKIENLEKLKRIGCAN